MRHPIQPLASDEHGVLRFKSNKIVRYLLKQGEAHGINLNTIAMGDFDAEDRIQFAQLIGYSLGGFCDLSYVDEDTKRVAEAIHESGITEEQARIATLEAELAAVREGLREPMARLFGVHPDDLGKSD